MSNMFFCVMASPICTAEAGDASFSSTDENVAPWMPSLPMRPPTITTQSPGAGLLEVRRLITDTGRHQPAGAAEDQGLAGKARVEHHRAVDVGNAALIGAVLDAAVDALEDALGVQQPSRQGL